MHITFLKSTVHGWNLIAGLQEQIKKYVGIPEVCCRNSDVQSETIICCGSLTLYS